MRNLQKSTKKVLIGVAGGILLIIGIIMIPYPGPGWLIVFLSLGLLSSEFKWAGRLLEYVKIRYEAWTAWLKQQNWLVRLSVLTFTGLVVVFTLWMLNTYGFLASEFDLDIPWLNAPYIH